jgi:hypothetical protein
VQGLPDLLGVGINEDIPHEEASQSEQEKLIIEQQKWWQCAQ